jgi:hypothetical protein
MSAFEYDARFLRAGVEELEQYLFSKEIYWLLVVSSQAGEPPYPRFTLGWLMLYRRRATALAKTPAQKTQIESLNRRIDELRAHWRSAWGLKAQQEFHARIGLWRDFMEEYRESPAANYDRYVYEVNRRILLTLLAEDAAGISPQDQELLAGLDNVLRADLAGREFIWIPDLAEAFPRQEFWYLYGRLPKAPA